MQHSYVRAYLNGLTSYGANGTIITSGEYYYSGNGLLQQAFSASQTALRSSSGGWKKGSIGDNVVTSSSTSTGDYVFLLDYKDLEGIYGWQISMDACTSLIKYPTDYAVACGAYKAVNQYSMGGEYWLRSSSVNYPLIVKESGVAGEDHGEKSANSAGVGVVPALFLQLA